MKDNYLKDLFYYTYTEDEFCEQEPTISVSLKDGAISVNATISKDNALQLITDLVAQIPDLGSAVKAFVAGREKNLAGKKADRAARLMKKLLSQVFGADC